MYKNFYKNFVFTSEAVSEGHPDKVCDRISDAIVDHYLAADSASRVAAEALVTTDRVVIAGEVRGPAEITPAVIEDQARQAVRAIGYEQDGFHWQHMQVEVLLHQQSSDIAQGVDASEGASEGAGDQGIMFGFACRETEALMPAPIFYAQRIVHSLARARHEGALTILGPDAKSQISVRYEDGQPVGADAIVVSTQHIDAVSTQEVRAAITPLVHASLPEGWMCPPERFYVNPTGRFVIGGPDGDAGLTGRKIIVDTYGGMAPHGGGAFSGKDPTKVDRSAAYMARYLAKNIVKAGLMDRCTLQLSYAIGVPEPLSIYINDHGTTQIDIQALISLIRDTVILTPRGIIDHLGLARPIYERTAAYGHFGRAVQADGGFSWEGTDLAGHLGQAFGEKAAG
ncbi:MAG: methionine adenosyltransferase [Pseudomonadota bacterium]